MSLVIVPLAGPDFYTIRFGIRPLYPYNGTTLLQYVLNNRQWINMVDDSNKLVFVLREEIYHTDKMVDFLKQHYCNSKNVILGDLTNGALLSSLVGVSFIDLYDEPVIIDLADIAFDWTIDLKEFFSNNREVDAIVPYFNSSDSKFSYLAIKDGYVTSAREKQVISSNASAGVYIFRNASVYLRAVAYCLENPGMCSVRANLFVCPSLNSIIISGRKVAAFEVENVNTVGRVFHE